jgi:hypothetical protein
MNKLIIILISLILIGGIVMSETVFKVESKRDIPSPLSPSFVNKIAECGKLDLIDRASVNYNPKALVDGSLKECDN